MRAITLIVLLGSLLSALSAEAAVQSRDQQRCIAARNAGFAKVAKTRSKAILRCAKKVAKGDAWAACLADQQRKLDRALEKLASSDGKKCAAAPDFGPQDTEALGTAGALLVDQAWSDLVGLAPDDVLADRKLEKDVSRCQLAVAKAAQKCALARVSAFNRCKKAGLKDGSIASATDLAACLEGDAGGRLARTCTAKLARAAERCAGLDLPAAFPACGAEDAAGLTACADGRIECRTRDAVADADALDVETCGKISPTADVARAASATIGTAGGEILATAGDGTGYRLSIPEGALLSDTEITVTPVTEIADLPLTGGLLAAVQFEPDGLQLWSAATLAIELTAAPDPATLGAFGWHGDGDAFHLLLPALAGSTLQLPVTHFSGVGAAIVAPENLAALQALPPQSAAQQFLSQALSVDVSDPGSVVAWLAQWYDQGVVPRLQAAVVNDEALRSGLADFVFWRAHLAHVALAIGVETEFLLGLDGFALANRDDAGLELSAAALAEAVERNDALCLAQQHLDYAESVLRWAAVAAQLGVATPAHGLDPAAILDGLCVEVLYDVLSYPESPSAGVPGTLIVRVGYAFGGGGPFFDQEFSVTVLPSGTVESLVTLPAPGGQAQTSFTPTGAQELVLDIDACLFAADYTFLGIGAICQSAILIRGFEISPESANLEPGESLDFEALLFGSPHPSVSWSATGGTITPAGLYTAGDVAGTYSVTATSNTSGTSQSATVTIGDGEGPVSLTVLDLVANNGALGDTCDGSQVSDQGAAGPADLPAIFLSASATSDGAGTSDFDFSIGEDAGTGVVTIQTDSQGTGTWASCPGGSPLPVANGSGAGYVRIDFELDGTYTFDLEGSVSGSGDYEVSVRIQSLPTPSTEEPAYCLIRHDNPGIDTSCPGGSTLADSGSLAAGSWRFEVFQGSEGWTQFPVSAASFDATLTLTPQ